jgi:hypothetical protein
VGRARADFLGKRTVLIGAGYSAATTAVALRTLVLEDDDTSFVWLTRVNRDKPIRVIPGDRLPQRRRLCEQANQICREHHPRMRHLPGAWVRRVDRRGDGKVNLAVKAGDGTREDIEAHWVVANVGYSADRSVYDRLQIHECYATGAPMKLAASLMNVAAVDCLDRPPVEEGLLENPEPRFFIIGNKSYGSDPTFLLQNGLAQAEQVVRMMSGESR